MKLISHDLSDLPEMAGKLIEYAGEEPVWIFRGEIGAGKTTLIKAICKQLGVEEPVVSPTFALVNTYASERGPIHHFDWYRIRQEGEALEIGWDEYLDSGDLLLIEWPEKIENLLPEQVLEIRIEARESGEREIQVHRG